MLAATKHSGLKYRIKGQILAKCQIWKNMWRPDHFQSKVQIQLIKTFNYKDWIQIKIFFPLIFLNGGVIFALFIWVFHMNFSSTLDHITLFFLNVFVISAFVMLGNYILRIKILLWYLCKIICLLIWCFFNLF